MSNKKKTDKDQELPKVNPELEGFEVKIGAFGEIITSYDQDKINEFLNRKLYDKKLKNLPEDSLPESHSDSETE
jgi:hypothetical protein